MQSSTALQVQTSTIAPLKKRANSSVSKYGWTEEKVNRLLRMSELGSAAPSMREMAIDLFGTELARGAIAGKMFRMGLCKKITKGQRAAKRAAPHRSKNRISNYGHNPARFGPQPDTGLLTRTFKDLDINALMPLDTSFLCTLEQLTPAKCRAPIGDPENSDFRFCGTPAYYTPGPYCNFHYQMFYIAGTTHSGKKVERLKVLNSEPTLKIDNGKFSYDEIAE